MFSSLTTGSSLYVLQRNDNALKLSVATVESRTEPTYRQPTYGLPNLQNALVTLKVTIDGAPAEFQGVPAQASKADFGNTVIAETREIMLSEVERMMAQSQAIIDSVPRHQSILQQSKQLLTQLNPSYAKELEQELRVSRLEQGVDELKTILVAINEKLK